MTTKPAESRGPLAIEQRVAELEKTLWNVKAYIHNRDHAICQGGHPYRCDCLGILLEKICDEDIRAGSSSPTESQRK